MKYEILDSTGEDEAANEALLAVKAIASTLSFGLLTLPPTTTALARYLKMITKECIQLLQEPQQKKARPAGQILAAVAEASAPACAFIIQSTLSALLLIYSDGGSIAKQRALLDMSNLLLDAVACIYGIWTDATAKPAIENPLGEHKEKLFEIYSQALMSSNRDETSFRLTAMRGLGKLCKIRHYLEENEIGMVVQYLDEVALQTEEKTSVREEAIENLQGISKLKSQLIRDITFPAFMAQLPDSEADATNIPYTETLEALAKLSFERPLFEVLLTRLLNKLDYVLASGSGPAFPRAILSAILYVLLKKPQSTSDDMKAYYARLVPPLVTKTILPLIGNGDSPSVLANDEVLDVTGRLINIVVRSLELQEQSSTMEQSWNLFVANKPSNLIVENADGVARDFKPLQREATTQQASCVTMFACTLSAIRREVDFPVQNDTQLLETCVELCQHPRSSSHRLSLLRTIGLVVNKWAKSSTDSERIQKVTESLLTSITATDASEEGSQLDEKLRIVFWIAKGLIMRTDKYGMSLIPRLVQLLNSQRHGAMASRGFAVLLGQDDFLNKDNHAVIRMLSTQRTFSICVPQVTEGFKAAESSKPSYPISRPSFSNFPCDLNNWHSQARNQTISSHYPTSCKTCHLRSSSPRYRACSHCSCSRSTCQTQASKQPPSRRYTSRS